MVIGRFAVLLYFPIRKSFEILFVLLHTVTRHGVILSRQVLSFFFLKNSPISGILLVGTLSKVPIGITSDIRRTRIQKGAPSYLGSRQRSFFFGQSSLIRRPPVRDEWKGSGGRRQDDARAQYALQGLSVLALALFGSGRAAAGAGQGLGAHVAAEFAHYSGESFFSGVDIVVAVRCFALYFMRVWVRVVQVLGMW
jgi:hypothetical protein